MNLVRLVKTKYIYDDFHGLNVVQKEFLKKFINLKSYFTYDYEGNIVEEYLFLDNMTEGIHFIITYAQIIDHNTNTVKIKYGLNCSYRKVWYPIEQKYRLSYFDVKKMVVDTLTQYLQLKNVWCDGCGMYY